MDSKNNERKPFVFMMAESSDAGAPEENRSEAAGLEVGRFSVSDSVADWEQGLEALRRNKQNGPDAGAAAFPDNPNRVSGFSALRQNGGVLHEKPVGQAEHLLRERSASPVKHTEPLMRRTADQPVVPLQHQQPTERAKSENVLDAAQREAVYKTFLSAWQQQTTTESQENAPEEDPAVLFQEDWLAAQSCLKAADGDTYTPYTVRLNGRNEAELLHSTGGGAYDAENRGSSEDEMPFSARSEDSGPVVHVHLHVTEPRHSGGRPVAVLSEKELTERLQEKLRMHLADMLAGMVRVAVQKQSALMISRIQQELLEEIPAAIDEVLQHNLQKIIGRIKK